MNDIRHPQENPADLDRTSAGKDKLLELKGISKSFGTTDVLRDIDLSIERGEFITFLGASGCGKTTTLRIIAGLEIPDKGQVILEGRDVTLLEPHQRDVNTVFQNYALFPHMNVEANIGYGLKIRRVPKNEIKEKVRKMLDLVQLSGYEKRMPSELSGGQKQRVAIARSLINSPRLLLLDEPLGALDLKLRRAMQTELKRLQKKLGITFLYITHDQEEAINMSDRIVVMRDGHFEQIGTPDEIYNRPKTSYVADFVGNANIISGVVERIDGELTDIRVNSRLITAKTVDGLKEGGRAVVAVRRENIKVCRQCKKGLPAVITDKSFNAGQLHMVFKLEDGKEVVASHYGIDTDLTVDQKVCVGWEPEHAVFVDMDEAAQGA
ncbi:ABC transporter ATP-binding protein [Blautia pseudococcoides]|uniref:ABC transporter ATP-binding protein n=1 Tax=Blautia pseudococcoides TaxID=1796616 RepID=UPI001FAC9AA7|nr:ABC transporter ATP-binding protein [Blautia pseudococcoides]